PSRCRPAPPPGPALALPGPSRRRTVPTANPPPSIPARPAAPARERPAARQAGPPAPVLAASSKTPASDLPPAGPHRAPPQRGEASLHQNIPVLTRQDRKDKENVVDRPPFRPAWADYSARQALPAPWLGQAAEGLPR